MATVLLLAVAACSSGKDTYTPPPPPPTHSTTSPATGAHVPRKQVLSLDDLPVGWSIARKVTNTTASLPPCYRAAASTKGAKKVAHAYFAQGGKSPVLAQTIAYYPKSAVRKYRTAVKNLERCGKVSYRAKKIKVTGSVNATSFPALGDKSSAYTANLKVGGLNLTLYLVIVRRTDELLTLSMGVSGAGDISVLTPIAHAAADRLKTS